MRNKFFFGAVGFFLVCLFVVFAVTVGRAATVREVQPVDLAVVVDEVQPAEVVVSGEVMVNPTVVDAAPVASVVVEGDVEVEAQPV